VTRLIVGIVAGGALIVIAAAVLLAAVAAARYRRGGPWDQREMEALSSGDGSDLRERWMRQHMPEFMGDPPRWWEADEFELGDDEYHAKYGRRADCGICGPAGCEGAR
jgi:hypothetical protein